MNIIVIMASGCFQYNRDTILKAIHNLIHLCLPTQLLFSIQQRYNFESNSQPSLSVVRWHDGCFQYNKDTILKAIHNLQTTIIKLKTVVFNTTKIQF